MQINDIKRIKPNKYIWLACVDCGKERWVNFDSLNRPNYGGRCKSCDAKHSPPHKSSYNGRFKDSEGYIWVRIPPSDPLYSMTIKNNGRPIREHRLIMARKLGRVLKVSEVIHHLNGIRDDNRIENLSLETAGSHVAFHNSHGAYRGSYPRTTD